MMKIRKDRYFAFLGENSAAVAVDINPVDESNAEVTVALAFCNHRDRFEKKIARDILNGRINAAHDPNHKKPVKLVFNTIYRGSHPKSDILNKVMDELRSLSRNREYKEVINILDNVQEDLEQVALTSLHTTAHFR